MSTHEPKENKSAGKRRRKWQAQPARLSPEIRHRTQHFGWGDDFIPLIGYVMSSFVKRLPLKWTSLGALDKFPEGRPGLLRSRIPTTVRGMAKPRSFRAGFAVSEAKSSKCSRSIVPILAVRYAGSKSPSFSCARAMAVFFMRTASTRPDHLRGRFTPISTKWNETSFSSLPASCLPWRLRTYERDSKEAADDFRL